MQDFIHALTSEGKSEALPEEYNYFGKLVGNWKIDYIDNNTSRSIKGEWHFAWVLGGMAIQDVVILPNYEHGTTLRVYNPDTHAWDVAYCFTGKIMRLEARKQDDKIILTHINNEKRKWIFTKIEDNKFHWQDVILSGDGEWHTAFNINAERI